MAPESAQPDLDRRLHAADPAKAAVDGLADLSLAVAREIVAGGCSDRRRPWPRRRGAVIGGTVAALIAIPTAAYAGSRLFAAETGRYGGPGMTENDTSQYIDVCAVDFSAYLHALPAPTDQPPPGWTWSTVADRLASQIRQQSAADCAGPGAVMQRTGLRAQFYLFAQQRWERAGLTEHRAGHDDAARKDLRLAALMMERLDELHSWGDDGWQRVHHALLTADWPAVEDDLAVNGGPDGAA